MRPRTEITKPIYPALRSRMYKPGRTQGVLTVHRIGISGWGTELISESMAKGLANTGTFGRAYSAEKYAVEFPIKSYIVQYGASDAAGFEIATRTCDY